MRSSMSTVMAWQNLKNLVAFDNELNILEKALTDAQKEIALNKNLIQQLSKHLFVSKELYTTQKKKVDLAELETKNLNIREDHAKIILEQTTNSKEFKAITKEIRDLKDEITQQEDILVTAWDFLDKAQKTLTSEQATFEIKTQELNAAIEHQEKAIIEFQKKIDFHHTNRTDFIRTISKENFDQYERMRQHVTDPIVPVVQNSCSICFYNILLHDLSKLKKSDLVLCKSCYRFLYYEATEEIKP